MIKPNNPLMDGLRQLMYTNFIVLKKYSLDGAVKNWPDKSIKTTSTLYKWMEGVRDIPLHQLVNLSLAVKDPIYIDYIANQAGYSIIPQIKDKTTLKVFSQFFKVIESAINVNNDETK